MFYQRLIRGIAQKTFSFWQMLGFHLTPVHFYSPIPDVKKLKNNLWNKNYDLAGIDIEERKQIELLNFFSKNFRKEYNTLFKDDKNTEFGPVDTEILYCMIRHLKPKKIMEIGSGYSTLIMAEAIKKNGEENYSCELISIDPYPKKFIQNKSEKFFKFIKKEIQDVPLDGFAGLSENDILFIDSSHVLKIGSDVQYEFLEILPRLHKGVVVHVHDIFFPSEYPKGWVTKEHRFFNEQYLLQAFLAFNSYFGILWAASFMHLKYPELLLKAFDSYKEGVWPGSFWMKKIK